MKQFIIRILKTLSRLGIIGRVAVFKYIGEGVSLNKFYSQGHWRTRQTVKDKYRLLFEGIIKPHLGKFLLDNFYLIIFYNSRHDCDNVIGMEKIFMDCLKGRLIEGDGRVNYKGVMIFYTPSLPKNTFEFVLIEGKYDEFNDIKNNNGK